MVNGIDIASILFRDILRMYEYPGAPFTGDTIRDIVTFFFVPTVFLIAVIFFSTGIVFGYAWRGFRLLFGLAGYLFVIVSGYYSIFAYIAGPYFFFLIIGVGLFYFLARHFRRPQLASGGGGGPSAPAPMPAEIMRPHALEMRRRIQEIDEEIRRAQRDLDIARRAGVGQEAEVLQKHLLEQRAEKDRLEKELAPWRKYI